jgi:ADP-heptose:LPS heptosyltransferase
MSRHALVARLDRLGDMIICGPAIRAVANCVDRVSVLAAPAGADAAALLPGVDGVLVWDCPWIGAPAPAVTRADVRQLVDRLAAARVDEALVLTSFHQNALPTALLLRLAGVPRIAAVSDDYPGSLLDIRIVSPPDAPEPARMLAVARAAGYHLASADDGRLAVRTPAAGSAAIPGGPFVAVHPGVDAPARGYPEPLWRDTVARLTRGGRTVTVTGSVAERAPAARVADAAELPGRAIMLAGRTDLGGLAAVLRAADVLVCANTGPAHLAAAVGTPVVSLFAPVVPAARWAPYGVPVVLLGDQHAPCADTRARACPVLGHPCLTSVTPEQIEEAVGAFSPHRAPALQAVTSP